MTETTFTRRAALARTAAAGAAMALPAEWLTARAGAATSRPIPLPSPAQVRADFQRMVDFGPRLTGSEPHNRFIDWLQTEFVRAGCQLLPCDVYETSRWSMQSFGLDVLEGAGAGPVPVASYFPRSQATPPQGVTGPLVYGGTLPPLSINGADGAALLAALNRYPADVAGWAKGISGLAGANVAGSVLLVDLPMPPPLTQGALAADMTFYNGQGETEADLATEDYKRLWAVPGLVLPLDTFTAMGVAGVVFIVDASAAALNGCYAPFEWFNEGVPALYVDRDTGTRLRAQAATRPSSRLTLTATRTTVPTATVNAVLPGASSEVIILDSHTDGTNFVEENGGVALVHLARYFGSLPRSRRLRRTLVFACWPGHFSNDLPQAGGWIKTHGDIVSRTAAALTVEHLGCTEWNDNTATGYAATGRPELFYAWTTQGAMFDLARDSVVAHNLPRTALMRPPAQVGVGGPFQAAGIPQVGAIAGPEYLLTVSASGEMEKLDPALAARQIAWLADLITRLDPVSAATLRQGDPTLGLPSTTGNIVPSSAQPTQVACGPSPAAAGSPKAGKPGHHSAAGGSMMHFANVVVDDHGYEPSARGVVLTAWATRGVARHLSFELCRDERRVGSASVARLTRDHRRVVLRARHHGLPRGRYVLIVRLAGHEQARRVVHVG